MRKEIRQKMVNYEVFICDDGKEFETEEEALLHDKLLRGEIKECPECHGKGRVEEWKEWENYHTGAPERMLINPICDRCHGKGYLEKKIKEVWE